MHRFTRAFACVAAVACASGAQAATRYATPATLAFTLSQAQPGDVVKLAAGTYSDVVLPVRNNATAITIDASAATVRSLMIRGTSGWVWKGGRIVSPLPPAVWRNVMIDNARRIEVTGTTLTGGHTGVLVTRGSSDIMLRNNNATGLQSDGFNIATATRVSLIGNTCQNFNPIPPVYDASGKLLKDGTHPDCIMMWSEKDQVPTSDITIIGNRAIGKMQGISHFWHAALGRDKVYRVRAYNNVVDVTYWHGIMLDDTPGSDVRNNRVSSAAGARMLNYPYAPIRTWLKASGDGETACDNVVEDYPTAEPTVACVVPASTTTTITNTGIRSTAG